MNVKPLPPFYSRHPLSSTANQVAGEPSLGIDAFRQRCLQASGTPHADAIHLLANAVDDTHAELDLSKIAPEILEGIDVDIATQFATLRSASGWPVTKVVLPDGMTCIPPWLAAFDELKTLQAHAMNWGQGDPAAALNTIRSLERADLTNGQFAGTEWAKSPNALLSLEGANLSKASLKYIELTGVKFQNADLSHATLTWVDLSGANLSGCNMANSHWEHVVLSNAQASGAQGAEFATFRACEVADATLPAVLSAHVRSDDVLRPGDTLTISETCPFTEAIKDMCRSKGLRLSTAFAGGRVWFRDMFFRTAEPPQGVFRAPSERADPSPQDDLLARNHLDSFRRDPLSSYTKEWQPCPVDRNDSISQSGWDQVLSRIPTHVNRFIEGGNVIITENRCCVIGHDELKHGLKWDGEPLTNGQVERIARRYPNVQPETAVALWRARREAKKEIREVLGAKALVVIPQYFFHIDLQMTYLGGDQFLVHSFEETRTFLVDHEAALRDELGAKTYEEILGHTLDAIDRGEDRFVDKAVRRLEQAGLEATPCCLMLLNSPISEGKWKSGALHSLFSNGLTVDEDGGRRTYVTLGAPDMKTHKDYFRTVCQQHSVSAEFMCDEHWPMPDATCGPLEWMNSQLGGLRCMSQKLNAPLTKDPLDENAIPPFDYPAASALS